MNYKSIRSLLRSEFAIKSILAFSAIAMLSLATWIVDCEGKNEKLRIELCKHDANYCEKHEICLYHSINKN